MQPHPILQHSIRQEKAKVLCEDWGASRLNINERSEEVEVIQYCRPLSPMAARGHTSLHQKYWQSSLSVSLPLKETTHGSSWQHCIVLDAVLDIVHSFIWALLGFFKKAFWGLLGLVENSLEFRQRRGYRSFAEAIRKWNIFETCTCLAIQCSQGARSSSNFHHGRCCCYTPKYHFLTGNSEEKLGTRLTPLHS